MRFIKQIARILRNTENTMIGRKLVHGPFFLPGFWSGSKIPVDISFGFSPVSADLFSISAIPRQSFNIKENIFTTLIEFFFFFGTT